MHGYNNNTNHMLYMYSIIIIINYLLRIKDLDRSKNKSAPPQNANRMTRTIKINPSTPPTMLILSFESLVLV